MICFDFFAQDLGWFQYHRSEMFLTCAARELCNIASKKLVDSRNLSVFNFDHNDTLNAPIVPGID